MAFGFIKLKKLNNSDLTLFCNLIKKQTGKRWTSKYFVTTPIFYVNAEPHVGHLYTAVIGDAAVRFQKIKNASTEVKFTVGTDEHGLKISQAAQKLNIDTKTYCDNVSKRYKELFNLYSVDADDFIRTTEERHLKAATALWNKIHSNDFIYKSEYSGWYCVADEMFVSEVFLDPEVDKNGARYTLEGKKLVNFVQEVNYKFKLSKFRDELLYWLKNGDIVKPKVFHDILYENIGKDEIMEDVSVSRPVERVSWGIPVPGDPSQTMYVWLDALSSYLSSNGYPHSSFKWPPDLQIIGKDILKFHGIYWPAFLMAADLEPPKSILCHSHWIKDGEKMSKSKGNVVDPFEQAKKYTSDGFRYFLLSKGVPHSDGNLTVTKVTDYLNSDLGDTLGNLLGRCTGSAINSGQVFPMFSKEKHQQYFEKSSGSNLANSITELPEIVENSFNEFNFYRGIEHIIASLHLTNKFFFDEKPWELCKKPESKDQLNFILNMTMESLRVCGILLQPIVPNISSNLLNKLSIPKNKRSLKDIRPFSWEVTTESSTLDLMSGRVVLFPKLKKEKAVG